MEEVSDQWKTFTVIYRYNKMSGLNIYCLSRHQKSESAEKRVTRPVRLLHGQQKGFSLLMQQKRKGRGSFENRLQKYH